MYCTIEVQEGAINSVAKHTLFTLANPSHSPCPTVKITEYSCFIVGCSPLCVIPATTQLSLLTLQKLFHR